MAGRQNRMNLIVGTVASFFIIVLPLLVSAGIDSPQSPPKKNQQSQTKTIVRPTDDMLLIPAGSFLCGYDGGTDYIKAYDEPLHRENVRPFFIDKHEVTVSEYKLCVDSEICKTPRFRGDEENRDFCNWDKSNRMSHPVNGVDWNDADTYCRWLGKRLPTGHEFEYVLRNGKDTCTWPWGNTPTPPENYGNYSDRAFQMYMDAFNNRAPSKTADKYNDGYSGTAPVCSFPSDSYSLCDIGGNVHEWVNDNIESGTKIVRGGGYYGHFGSARCANRSIAAGFGSTCSFGFRCAKDEK